MNLGNPASGSPKDDPLLTGPPLPDLPDAQTPAATRKGKGDKSVMPRASTEAADRATKTAHLLGLSPAMTLAKGIMDIQKIIEELAPHSPALVQVFAPAIAQARDIAAASLANM